MAQFLQCGKNRKNPQIAENTGLKDAYPQIAENTGLKDA
jgi:hypothetical protein